MKTNIEREEFRQQYGRRHDDVDVGRALVVVGAIILTIAIAIGIWSRYGDDPYVRTVTAECEAQGKVAHVDRDDADRVLAVRCDLRP